MTMTFFILAISFMTDAYNHPEAHTCDDATALYQDKPLF